MSECMTRADEKVNERFEAIRAKAMTRDEKIKLVCESLLYIHGNMEKDCSGSRVCPCGACKLSRELLAGMEEKPKVFGCQVDYGHGEGVYPDCVFDAGRKDDCTHAFDIKSKYQCKFWKEIEGAEHEEGGP